MLIRIYTTPICKYLEYFKIDLQLFYTLYEYYRIKTTQFKGNPMHSLVEIYPVI